MTSTPLAQSRPTRQSADPKVEAIKARRTDLSQDPEIPTSPPQEEPLQPGPNAPPRHVAVRRRAAHYAGLVLASMIGCLIRLGLDAMATYDGQVIFALAWSQGVGCGIMGLALARKKDITDFYPPLYTFITTGIAGSVTTFSSWMLEGYQAFSNPGGRPRGGFYDSVDGFAYSFATFAIAFGGLYLGEYVSKCLPSFYDLRFRFGKPEGTPKKEIPSSTSTSPTPRDLQRGHRNDSSLSSSLIVDCLVLLSAALSYLIALLLYFLGPTYWRHRATFPILLAPPGAMLRFYLSNLNTRQRYVDRYPLGTFLANMIGTLLIGGVYSAQFIASTRDGSIRCNALWAIQEGLCGCLTTVSTFVVECRSIKGKKWTWTYAGSSIVLGHICVLITYGAAGWSGQLGEGICSA